jgi:steroid 5-alpha reductase family enzyme
MTYEAEVVRDFFYEMWVYQFPKVLFVNLILYLIFIWKNVNSLVDFGWALNQFIIGLALVLQYYQKFNGKTLAILIVLFIWFLRLGGFLFVTRVLKKTNDKRYEEMAKRGSDKRRLWFLFQFTLQGKLTSLFGDVPGFADILYVPEI